MDTHFAAELAKREQELADLRKTYYETDNELHDLKAEHDSLQKRLEKEITVLRDVVSKQATAYADTRRREEVLKQLGMDLCEYAEDNKHPITETITYVKFKETVEGN